MRLTEKFCCSNSRCIEMHKEEDEDIRLQLHISEGVIHKYHFNDDGSLTHYDSDGTGQDVYLECQLCGTKYEFDTEYFEIEEKHVLPFTDWELEKMPIKKMSQ